MDHYWLTDHTAPFAMLLRVVGTYCHPEAGPTAYGDLRRLARIRAESFDMVRFKDELSRALTGDVDELPADALFSAAAYGDGSDEAFLVRLWHDLYPGQPVPVAERAEEVQA